ncbi:hypothetical protein [Streptomyces viridochromogenes]|nr:hypothetical protein [Streptomyces viridochromogenes]
MDLRGRKRRQAGELRAKYIANREKVRSWRTRWDCPEVEWPRFPHVPLPWVVRPDEQDRWLKHTAPHMDAYEWVLPARPLARGVSELQARWGFHQGHEFEGLTIRFRSVLDPDYLAERISLGIHAAALEGWRDDDLHSLYDWLREGVTHCTNSGMVTGTHRSGFLLFKITCAVLSRTEISTEVRTTLTDTSLDGAPLHADGSS